MNKKAETKKQTDYMENYRENTRKVQVLSKLATHQFLGSPPAGDPRQAYLLTLEVSKNLANSMIEVFMDLAIIKLGVSRDDFLQLVDEKLTNQIKAMEQDLCVTSWDKQGNPIFDLKRYAEKTATWPV